MFLKETDPFTGEVRPLSREQKLVIGLTLCSMGLVVALGIDGIARFIGNLVTGS